jgi:lipoprotein-releasing system permease protein
MYQSLLVLRFLTSRIMPVIAVLAVALCVTLVIVVVSVMTGFLDMLRASGKRLVGDVVIQYPVVGIPYYRDLIADIEALDEAEAASPLIETLGIIKMPYGVQDKGSPEGVDVWAIEPESLDRVLGFRKLLYWRETSEEERSRMAPEDPRRDPAYDYTAEAMAMMRPNSPYPGVILGIELSPFNHRQRDGSYRTHSHFASEQDRGHWMPRYETSLTLVPVTESGTLAEQRQLPFAIVNEFQTGVFQIDSRRVMIPLAEAQKALLLAESTITSKTEFDENGQPKVLGVSPARVTTILVKAAPGVDPRQLREAVKSVYQRFAELKSEDPSAVRVPMSVDIMTWEERMRDLIGPVEKERGLMQVLFSLVYIVCAGLVLAIFWSIVHEKTRDIGVMRSVGASRTGILSIFLAYGLAIGIVGSTVGLGLAWLVISRINEIHSLMGEPAPLWLALTVFAMAAGAILGAIVATLRDSALFTLLWIVAAVLLAGVGVLLLNHKGLLIWDPSVYYFSRIPNTLDLTNALMTMGFAILFSVIGAAIPAARAADTDPVRSLRYE